MPARQRKLVSDNEKEVGLRVFYWRKMLKITRAKLAAATGITLDHLASVELGRTPLKLKTAWEICRFLDTHPAWLKWGGNHESFPLDHPNLKQMESIVEGAKEARFSEAWTNFGWLLSPPPDEAAIIRKEWEHRAIKRLATIATQEQLEKSGLAKLENPNNISHVKKTVIPENVADLIAQVKILTKKRGQKTALAKNVLKVSTGCLSDWLSGKCYPDGKSTLALIHWVQEQSAKK